MSINLIIKINIRHSLENSLKVNQYNENKNKDLENDLNDIVTQINSEIKIIMQWIETYLGVYYEDNIDLPDLPYTISKSVKSKFNLDQLKKIIYNSRKNLNEEFKKLSYSCKETSEDNFELVKKLERLNQENGNLKNEVLIKNDEIFNLTQDIDKLAEHNILLKDSFNKNKQEINERIDKINVFCEKIYGNLNKCLERIKNNPFLNIFSDLLSRNTYTESLVIILC